jgi:hypothetical protein
MIIKNGYTPIVEVRNIPRNKKPDVILENC